MQETNPCSHGSLTGQQIQPTVIPCSSILPCAGPAPCENTNDSISGKMDMFDQSFPQYESLKWQHTLMNIGLLLMRFMYHLGMVGQWNRLC